jgi:DNA-binding NtrC family response regulator
MKLGASGYYAFPNDYRKLSDRIQQLLDEWRLRRTQREFATLQRRTYDFDQIVGRSDALHATLHKARKVIENASLIVLITGETGTGKELLARAIHYNGKNSGSPFVDIACSAIPESLLESELFGFEKGAFTDARERKVGLFELAGEGSIFLDEIGDISPAIQSKLLKVIEGRTMRRLGGTVDIPVKARIIAATSVDLDARMKAGNFRRDLYHRLKILPLEIPPLRERTEDIPALAESFIGVFNKVYDKHISGISREAMELLLQHKWEGNIRELKHCIERAMLLEEKQEISAEHLAFLDGHEPVNGREAGNPADRDGGRKEPSVIDLQIPLEQASLADVQRSVALKVLAHVGGNKSKAAFILRISRPRLDRILKNE